MNKFKIGPKLKNLAFFNKTTKEIKNYVYIYRELPFIAQRAINDLLMDAILNLDYRG